MGKFVKGDVVVLPFPFSNLSASKKRPALVVATLKGDDLILTQITTVSRPDGYSIPLFNSDFNSGGLPQNSNIRPNRIFTGDSNIVISKAGSISKAKTDEVIKKIVQIVKS